MLRVSQGAVPLTSLVKSHFTDKETEACIYIVDFKNIPGTNK